MRRLVPAVLVVLFAVLPATARAQQTRAEIARQAREKKAAELHPYEPNAAEKWLFRIEDRYLMARIFNPREGLFVRFGGMPEGAGLAAGPAYRYSRRPLAVTATTAASMRGYWEFDVNARVRNIASKTGYVAIGLKQQHLPQEDFFGLGFDSSEDDQTSFELDQTIAYLTGGASPTKWFTFAGHVERRDPRIGRGTDKRFPSIQDVFTDVTAPGLAAQPDFLRAGARFAVDYTDRLLGPPAGGHYSLAWDRYDDLDFSRYSFDQWTVDLRQYVPVVYGARTLLFRAYATGVQPRTGEEVPFYYMPTLGGPYTLRGLKSFRYRDRNLILFQTEYRFELNAFLTGAVFYDAGRVSASRGDLLRGDYRHDVGFGLRFGYASAVSLRTELAYGGEGLKLIFKFNDVF
jgi:hypothetical protein